ncbi:MAG: nucleotidyltransferase family protein [Gammaproteobacteria bacterium]|nr:nucleotidyltransferase family protein [Gammaproteobacteria bacterium]
MIGGNAMILAAGRGERLRPLTDDLPKPLIEVGGKPVIAWHLENLAAAGFKLVVINLSWLGQKVKDVLGDGRSFGLEIRYSDEGDTALETGGGIFKALPLLGRRPFVVINGDVFSDYPLANLSLDNDRLAHLVLVPNPPHNPSGDFGLRGKDVESAGELYTFSGIAAYDPEIFSECRGGIFPLAPVLRAAIDLGRVSGELWPGNWHDIGTQQRLTALQKELAD